MKKSMLMLVAFFALGACSATSDSSTWERKVGGKTFYKTSDGDLLGTFSADASTFTLAGGVITSFSQFSTYTEYNEKSVFYIIEDSVTSTSASYLSKDKTSTFQIDFETEDGSYLSIRYILIGNNTSINYDTQKTYSHIEDSFSK